MSQYRKYLTRSYHSRFSLNFSGETTVLSSSMASRYEVEVNITSAKDLKNVNWRYGPNKPYAVVWVDPSRKCSTKVDEEGDTSPYWDHTLIVPLPGPVDDETKLYIDIVHYGREEDTKPLIGSTKLKLMEVIDEVGYGEPVKRTLTLKRPSGRPQGKVDVKVTVKDKEARYRDAYYAPPYGVPPPPPPYGSAYAPPPPPSEPYGSAFAPPPPNPYYPTADPPRGYPYGASSAAPPPPQPYGQTSYGYGAQSNLGGQYYGEEKKKSKFGGMGTGLAVGAVAGALGGLALAEGVDALEDKVADDAAERVEDDLGYDGDDF